MDGPPIDRDDVELLPVTAWRTLADLKADAAVDPLVDLLCAIDDEFDDWAPEELPHVFGKIGDSAIEPLIRVAKNAGNHDFVRSIAASGLRLRGPLSCRHARSHRRLLDGNDGQCVDDDLQFNTTLLVELVELHAVDAAKPIERAFAANLLDVGMMGNWDDVRRQLGVEGLGLTMPEHPHNSIERLRGQTGLGIFSDQPIFLPGDIDDEAAAGILLVRISIVFRVAEGQLVIEKHGELRWFQ